MNMVSQQLLEELKVIISEDYHMNLQQEGLAELGNTLVSYFELLSKIEYQKEESEENYNG